MLAGSENEPNTFLISPNILDNQPTVKGSVGTTDHEHRLMLFDDSAPVPVRAETVAALARLPEGWRNQLRDDLQVADFSRVEEMVKSLQTGHPNPASTLGRLAGRFDAENLLQLLADAAANPSSQPG